MSDGPSSGGRWDDKDDVRQLERENTQLRADLTALRSQVAELERDKARYNYLKTIGEFHFGTPYEDGDPYELQQVTGNINDREYNLIGSGDSLDEAIDAALADQAKGDR